MKFLSFYAIFLFFQLLFSEVKSQEMTQVIRGKVVDEISKTPLPFATVAIISLNPPKGVTTNENGEFRLEGIPVGRHEIQISYVGYEAKIIPELMVSTGKEVVLMVGLQESLTQVEEVQVKAYAQKDKPLNSMASVSARTFSVEEAQRYAGGFDDPARLASSFAGVATGYLDDNGIIVRGNAPKGLLWRLEGVEIPNPNHFAGLTTFGGGGVSALSSLMLANSDFYTGAFPAEYGNAMSGVFDIRLRKGNSENYEHAVQVGVLGIDISSEGPFSRSGNSSYLFNYRYSTFGLIKPVLPEDSNVPVYQDLCFNINLPAGKAGNFSVWALAAVDALNIEPESDTNMWEYLEDREEGKVNQKMGAAGLNHRYILNSKSYFNSTLAVTGAQTVYKEGIIDGELNHIPTEYIESTTSKVAFTTNLNHKFGRRHFNRTGVRYNYLNYNALLRFAPEIGDDLLTTADDKGNSHLASVYSQSSFQLNDNFKLNIGFNSMYFNLNEEITFEPRLAFTYNVNARNSFSLAYGNHSRLEPLSLYLANILEGNEKSQPNKELKLTRAHHFVISYDVNLTKNLRLKVEPYAQFLYNVPVIEDSTYSTINMDADWYFTNKLVNDGTGMNYGLDVTLERFLNNGYYYLLTASLFDSRYVDGYGNSRQTRYNSNFVINTLVGKEWTLGASKNKFLGVNFRLNVLGGQRMPAVDIEKSKEFQYVQYDYSNPFSEQKPTVYHLNVSVTWRNNHAKYSSIWTLQVLNALGSEEFYGYGYNYRTQSVEEDKNTVVVPSIAYKIEF